MIPPDRRHTSVRAFASTIVVLLGLCFGAAGTAHALMISEVMFNPVGGFGSDDGLEWIELYNEATTPVLLDDFSLGWGTASYDQGTLDLDGLGSLAPGDFIVIYDTMPGYDFAPDLPDGFITAAGLGIFAGDASAITPASVPVDAVIYSTIWGGNWNGLVDETGAVGAVDTTTTGATESIERSVGGLWTPSATPTPDTGSPVPEPGSAILTAIGLGLLALRRSS